MWRLALADIHLSLYKDDNIEEDGLPYRLSKLIQILDNAFKMCLERKITQVDILGDLFNDKDILHNDSINAFLDLLLRYNNLHFNILSGNHDVSSLGKQQNSAISIYRGLKNVTCYREPVIIDNITLIPWSKQIVEHIKKSKPNKILLSHVGIDEGQLTSGLSVITGLGMKDFHNFKLVLLGDYHKPQHIHNSNVNIYYIGSPMHISWGDKNEIKRIIFYNTETLEIESLPTTGYTRYIELIIDKPENTIEVLKQADIEDKKGNKVKVVNNSGVELTNENIKQNVIVIENKEIDPTNRGLNISMGKKEIAEKYLTIKDIKKPENYMKVFELIVTNNTEDLVNG